MSKLLMILIVVIGMTAPAAADLVDASDPETLRDFMQVHGEASVEYDNVGDPVIIGRYNGAVYTVTFYGCNAGEECRDVIFHAAWQNNGVDIIALNDWNSRSRYGKAFFDEMGDPTIEMAVNLNWGVTQANFQDTIEWWFASMHHFSEEIGYTDLIN